MFVRVKRNVSKGIAYEYLQIVRSYREGGKVKQQIIGSLGRRDRLLAREVFPGNTADAAALGRVVALLRERFRIGRLVVADRGMISKETVKLLANHGTAPFDYVLGNKLRRSKEVREEVLSRGGRYQQVADNLEVKEVMVGGRCYVVCRNQREARKGALAREALVEKLKATLARPDAGPGPGAVGAPGAGRPAPQG